MITYVTPYYENGDMFREQLSRLEQAPEHVRGAIEYIVVDDGSPKYPALEELKNRGLPVDVNLKVFRILKDVRWNHIAARNIGVCHATHRWLMLTDMDHVVPWRTFSYLLGNLENFKKNAFYTFDRVDAPHDTPYKPHPHTWFMSSDMWDRFGGYDERFSGHYGMDFLARERLRALGEMLHISGHPVVRYPREFIADASTRNYERKSPEDRLFVKELRQKLKREGTYEQPLTLSFPYERVV